MVQVRKNRKITKLLTVVQLRDLLLATKINGGTFIYVLTYTREHNLIKPRTSPLAGLKKLTGTVGHAYAHHQYEKQRKKVEPSYKPQPRAWGVRLKDSPLVEHKGKYYLELFFDNNLVKTKTMYYHKGKTIDKSLVYPHLREKRFEPVVYRNYALDSIREIKVNGQGYRIIV